MKGLTIVRIGFSFNIGKLLSAGAARKARERYLRQIANPNYRPPTLEEMDARPIPRVLRREYRILYQGARTMCEVRQHPNYQRVQPYLRRLHGRHRY
jgi:hypothetical protein